MTGARKRKANTGTAEPAAQDAAEPTPEQPTPVEPPAGSPEAYRELAVTWIEDGATRAVPDQHEASRSLQVGVAWAQVAQAQALIEQAELLRELVTQTRANTAKLEELSGAVLACDFGYWQSGLPVVPGAAAYPSR